MGRVCRCAECGHLAIEQIELIQAYLRDRNVGTKGATNSDYPEPPQALEIKWQRESIRIKFSEWQPQRLPFRDGNEVRSIGLPGPHIIWRAKMN